MIKELFKKSVVVTDVVQKDKDAPVTLETSEILLADEDTFSDDAIRSLYWNATDFEVKKGLKIYFLPGVNVPRFKARPFFEQEGMAIVRTADKADVIIIGEKSQDAIMTRDWRYGAGEVATERLLDLGLVPEDTQYIIQGDWGVHSKMKNAFPTWYDYQSIRMWKADMNVIEQLDHALEKGKTFINEESLLKHINTGNPIDEETFQNMYTMFKSADQANHTLAMEILANSDYEQSAVYVLSILGTFASKINPLKEAKHVNFKGLLSFFDLSLPLTALNIDDMMEKLKERKLLSPLTKEIITNIARKEICIECSSNAFKIKAVEIELTDEWEAEFDNAAKSLLENQKPKNDEVYD